MIDWRSIFSIILLKILRFYRLIPIAIIRKPKLIPSNPRPLNALPAPPVVAPVGVTVVGVGPIELNRATDDGPDAIVTDAPLTFTTTKHGDTRDFDSSTSITSKGQSVDCQLNVYFYYNNLLMPSLPDRTL
jgi:hypothetical protein